MASLAHYYHNLPLIIFLITFLYIFINGNSIQSPNSPCPPFTCGNGIKIHYPFWHQNQQLLEQSYYCGYPGFNLSCNDQKNPMLHLSNHLYHVKNINYSHKSLFLAYGGLQNCPKTPHEYFAPITSSNSLFSATTGSKLLHFFYNCTLYPPSIPHLECLRFHSKRSYVFEEGTIPEFDWHRFCESTGSTLAAAVNGSDLVKDFGQALQDGFELTWHQPKGGSCQSCEANGRFCGYTNDLHKNFSCVCADGKRPDNRCYANHGVISIRPKPNYIVIGAVIMGLLSLLSLAFAATTIYFLRRRRRRVVSYKPV